MSVLSKLFSARVLVRQEGFPNHVTRMKIYHQMQLTGEGYSFVLKRKGLFTFEVEILNG